MKKLGCSLVGACLLTAMFGCERPDAVESLADANGAAIAGDSEDPLEVLPGQVSLAGEDRRFALLIGCSQYDHLGEDAQLNGPVNDVALMQTLLVDHFGMMDENVQVLSEATTDKCRPLKQNIARELARITQQLRPEDYVVVYFSGHGCQQPDLDWDNQHDPEPDGLDEVLLPADAEFVASVAGEEIENAISDDELRGWLDAMREHGASTWVIIDACHSGTVTRGRQVARQVLPESLFSPAVLQAARDRAEARGIQTVEARVLDADEQSGGIVAVYAAQPHEPTFEMPLPDEKHGQWRGLLTYTLAKVVLESPQPLSYVELMQRIQAEYVAAGHFGPTPLVEGSDRDRQVLGKDAWPQRAALSLSRDRSGKFSVNGGKLHGLTAGSILAIYPPVGQAEVDEPMGYVQIELASALSSKVAPLEYAGVPPPADLPAGGRCEPMDIDFGDARLKVAIADAASTSSGAPAWRAALERLSGEPSSPIALVETEDEADWIVEPTKLGQGVLVTGKESSASPRFGPIPPDDAAAEWFASNLARIARAQNLMRVAGIAPSERQRGWLGNLFRRSKLKTDAKLFRLADADDEVGELVEWKSDGVKLREGEIVALELTNSGTVQADLTVLFIDSRFGIEPLFPSPDTVADNRLPPGESLRVGPMQVQGDSVGFEHLLVVATNGQGQPLDFSWLAQDSLEQARSLSGSGTHASQNSALGQLLQHALFNEGNERGLKMADAADVAFRAISWQTVGEEAAESSESP